MISIITFKFETLPHGRSILPGRGGNSMYLYYGSKRLSIIRKNPARMLCALITNNSISPA